jgi:dienelactone hydrolase
MRVDEFVNYPSSAQPAILITPLTGRVDERVHISVVNLHPEQRILLYADQQDDEGSRWEAHAEFQADENGIVDVGVQQPLAGTYPCADGMGLFWSMALDPSAPRIHPFRKMTMNPLTITLRAVSAGQTIAVTTVDRLVLASTVDRNPVRVNGLVGTLFVPQQGGPYPGIIVLGGSGGGIWEAPAAILAAHGFTTLALAFFAYEHLPAKLAHIPLEYFETALAWLQAHPKVRPDRLGVMGTSRGGELALLLGATFHQVRAVVAYVPSNVIWEGFGPGVPSGTPAWSYHGQALPVIRECLNPELVQAVMQRQPIATTPLYHPALDDKSAVADAAIPVEQGQAAILLISGQDDQMWPSARMAAMVVERLQRHHYPYLMQHLSYPDAGHWIGTPYFPASTTRGHHSINGELYAYGGTVEGNAHAMVDSWSQVLQFLHQVGSPGW